MCVLISISLLIALFSVYFTFCAFFLSRAKGFYVANPNFYVFFRYLG